MKKILLSNRFMFALIDDEDFDRVSRYKWRAASRKGGNLYVSATSQVYPATHQLMHRFILKAKEDQIIDHINGNVLDNRRQNLRFCTSSENALNQHSEEEKRALRLESCVISHEKRCRTADMKRIRNWQRRADLDKGNHLAYEKHGVVFHVPVMNQLPRMQGTLSK
jgi:HNH endonuclease